MPFEAGQTVIHEVEVAGFSSKAVAVIRPVADGSITIATPAGDAIPGTFSPNDGRRLDGAGSANERLIAVPAPPSDLWGPRSGWIPAATPPQREGWYEFSRSVDGAVDLCYYVGGTWLAAAGEPLAIGVAGAESWQGLAADPVDLYLEAEPRAAEPPIAVAQPEGKRSAGTRPR